MTDDNDKTNQARLVHEHTTHHAQPDSNTDPDSLSPTPNFTPSCPFCIIAHTYPPVSPLSTADHPQTLDSTLLDPPSFVLFSSADVIAFLDIMPLTRGHVLVAPRHHRVKVGDLSAHEAGAIGRILPTVARAVMRTVLPDIPHRDADYNVVQNNGPGAAQVVPHVHFHVIPRPPLGYVYPGRDGGGGGGGGGSGKHGGASLKNARRYPPNEQPSARMRNAILFGRGLREDLDWDEAEELVAEMRRAIALELQSESEGEVESESAGLGVERLDSVQVGGDGGRAGREVAAAGESKKTRRIGKSELTYPRAKHAYIHTCMHAGSMEYSCI